MIYNLKFINIKNNNPLYSLSKKVNKNDIN